jgi:hypothetical protein
MNILNRLAICQSCTVQASIKSSIIYTILGGPGKAMRSLGRQTEHSFAVRSKSSWKGPAIGKPARDCVRASIPNCIASGPSLLVRIDLAWKETGNDIAKVQYSKHLQHWLIATCVLRSIVLIHQEEALLCMIPYHFLYGHRSEAFKVQQRSK